MAELCKIAEARGQKRANAVFFHGLGGDACTTWQADKNDRATFWPAWLAEDIEGLSVYSIGYEAPVSRWRGSAMHLTDRATNVLGDLLNEPGLANGALFLIGHSLGGLLIKQILRTAESEAQNDARAASFLRRVEKIAFLATPHAGADLAVWGDRLRILIRPSAATICLVRNDPNLRALNRWYRTWSNRHNIPNLVLTETKPLSILGMIVKPDSSDPGLVGPQPLPMDYDHVWICKPRSRRSDLYNAVRSFIETPFERPRDLVAERLEKLEAQQKEVAAQQKELAAQLARQKGVEVAPLLAVLSKLGEKEVPQEDIPKRLDAAADTLIALRAENETLRRGPPALAVIAEEVQALIDRGDFDAARETLERGRQTARTLRIEASRHEAVFLAQGARVDSLQLGYRSAASKYAEAAALVAPFDAYGEWRFLLRQADALLSQGDEFGDNDALAIAIDIYRHAADLISQADFPLDWAATQNNLGNALALLGERKADTARLAEAIVACRNALKEFTREREPLRWAGVQNNLGNALRALGEAEDSTVWLRQALAAYHNALKEWTRQSAHSWAGAQFNLSNVLSMIAEHRTGTYLLKKAVVPCRNALRVFTRKDAPLQWAATQHKLGTALQMLGERQRNVARLKRAIAAYKKALTVRTCERVPIDWAMTLNNLGNAHLAIGQLETGVAEFERAVAAYDEALNVYTPEHTPLLWAMTQYNLAVALHAWGGRENGTSRLKRAVSAYDEARKVYDEYLPQRSAIIIGKQGVARMLIAERLGNLTAYLTAPRMEVHYISANTRPYNVVVEVCFGGIAGGQ
jgi:tetratricopeptide (TPR) repeat protein